MEEYIVLGIIVVAGILICVLPQFMRETIANVFSMSDFGLRYSKWRRDNIDTFGNIMLFLGFIISIVAGLIPYGQYLFIAYFLFSFLCLVGQTFRISKDDPTIQRLSLTLAIYFMCAVAFVSAVFLVSPRMAQALPQFIQDMQEHKYLSFIYWFSRYEPLLVVDQIACYFAAYYVVWAQFKYMRLENHYKAGNLVFFWIKVVFVCLMLVAMSLGYAYLIEKVYYLE